MAQSPPRPPVTPDYDTPSTSPKRPIIDVSLAVICGIVALLLTAALFVLIPKAEATFRDFGTKLPTTTVVVLKLARLAADPWGLLWIWTFLAIPPFVAPLVDPTDRKTVHPARLLAILFLVALLAWVAVSVLWPLAALMQSVAPQPTRR